MRLLTFTDLYPSEDRPRHGIFVAERLRHLVAAGGVAAQVVALRPSAAGFLGRGSAGEVAPDEHGIPVHFVRVPTLPMLTNWIDPLLWANAAQPIVKAMLDDGAGDTILDAHFLYPDGVAAVLIGRRLGIPTVITARGSDVNVKCANPVMRRWIAWAAANCAAIVTVSRALATRLAEHRIHAPIVEVLPNGVDLHKFRPLDRSACRARFALDERLVLASVGHLLADKGHHIAIEALTEMTNTTLLIVGAGPQRQALESLARHRGVDSRVRFLGLVAHRDMPDVYNAADLLVLASVREGMPNVVLESLSCGTPVVATDVGGVAEVVTSPVAGELMRERSAPALQAAAAAIAARSTPRAETRAFAEQFDWSRIVARQVGLYREVCAGHAARGVVHA